MSRGTLDPAQSLKLSCTGLSPSLAGFPKAIVHVIEDAFLATTKDPGRGVKENLKPCVYKLWKHVKVQPRTFCRTVRRVADAGEVKE